MVFLAEYIQVWHVCQEPWWFHNGAKKNDEIVGILPQKLLAEEMQETAVFVEQEG